MVGKVGTYVWKANVNTQTPLNSEIDSDSSQPSKEVSLQRQCVLCVAGLVASPPSGYGDLGVWLGALNPLATTPLIRGTLSVLEP